MEIWKDVPNYDDRYQASNMGKIRSKTRKTQFGRGWRIYESQIMTPQEDKDGYYKVALAKDGRKKRFFVHRLVAMTFLGIDSERTVVNHKDGNKQNNNLSNLEWVTPSENTLHAFRTGLKKPHNGGTNKIVEKIDPETDEVVDTFNSITEASESMGCTLQLISMACRGKVKQAKGFVWRFK